MWLMRLNPDRSRGRPTVHLLQMLQMSLRVVYLVAGIFMSQVVHLVFVILHGYVNIKRLSNLSL